MLSLPFTPYQPFAELTALTATAEPEEVQERRKEEEAEQGDEQRERDECVQEQYKSSQSAQLAEMLLPLGIIQLRCGGSSTKRYILLLVQYNAGSITSSHKAFSFWLYAPQLFACI